MINSFPAINAPCPRCKRRLTIELVWDTEINAPVNSVAFPHPCIRLLPKFQEKLDTNTEKTDT